MKRLRSSEPSLLLFSLAIALVLAYLVRSDANSTVTVLSVPVEFIDVPADRVLVAGGVTQVRATVRGPSFVVNRLVNSVPSIRIKIPPQIEEHFTAVLSSDEVDIPTSVSVLRIDPETLSLDFDKLISKDVPVVLPRIGSVADGMYVEQVAISPEKVTLVGPSKEISSIGQVESLPIDLKGARESRTEKLSLRLPVPSSRLSPADVVVKVIVAKIQEERIFSALPIEVRTKLTELYSVSPREVSVAIRGDRDLVRAVQRDAIIPYIRLETSLVKSEEVSVSVDLPDNLRSTTINPSSVKVTPLKPRKPKAQ